MGNNGKRPILPSDEDIHHDREHSEERDLPAQGPKPGNGAEIGRNVGHARHQEDPGAPGRDRGNRVGRVDTEQGPHELREDLQEVVVGPQGRAIDLGLKVQYDITRQWYVGGGLRALEGGADNDEIYNFSWFNYAVLNAGYRF